MNILTGITEDFFCKQGIKKKTSQLNASFTHITEAAKPSPCTGTSLYILAIKKRFIYRNKVFGY